MKKGLFVFLILLFLSVTCTYADFDDESFSAWSDSIRKFSGMRNIQGKIEIRSHLVDSNSTPYELFYSMKFYSRDLRDYRIDFEFPDMLKGITVLYQYREKLLYVLNIEKAEYALQSFEAGEEIQFNPTTLLMEFLDFLIAIESISELNVYPRKTETGTYVFRIQLSPPEILLLFQKEYPSINIYLDSNNEIRKIILLNEQTEEELIIMLIDITVNASKEKIDEIFNISINQYTLIEYIGSN